MAVATLPCSVVEGCSGHGTEAKREADDWQGRNKIEPMHLSRYNLERIFGSARQGVSIGTEIPGDMEVGSVLDACLLAWTDRYAIVHDSMLRLWFA
jgi:hypothetical protein